MTNRSKTSGKRFFVGWDTETVNNGQVVLLTNSNKEYVLFPTLEEILNLMLEYQNNKYLNYFYNLDYDTKSIIMSIASKQNEIGDIRNFIETDHLVYKNYTLHYIGRKKLTIYENLHLKQVKYKDKLGIWCQRDVRQFTRKAEFYDISQFYLDGKGKIMKLQEACKIHLGFGKLDVDDIGNINIERLHNDKKYQRELIDYCIRDSFLTKRLCYVFYNMIKPYINVRKLLSPAYLSQKYIKKYLKDNDLETEYTNKHILKYEREILNSYYGGRFETFKKGNPEKELYLYDIKSAYPHYMRGLRGLTGQATLTNDTDLELSKCYPLINIDIENYDNYLNPLAFRNEGLIYFPSVRKPINKWVTEHSIKLLDLMKIDYSINRIIKFWKTDNYLFDFINDLYELKKSGKHKKVAKIILNSMYGKTVERTKRVYITDNFREGVLTIINNQAYYFKKVKKVRGQLYNPLWGTLITDFTRYYITAPIIKNHLQNNLYQIATDSILLDKKIDLPIGSNMGMWDFDVIHKPVIYGNGILEHSNGIKSRGFSCTNKEQLHNMVKNEKYYKEQLIPISHYNKWGFHNIHSFQLIEKKFTVNDRKRQFPKIKPIDLQNTLIDSTPLMY